MAEAIAPKKPVGRPKIYDFTTREAPKLENGGAIALYGSLSTVRKMGVRKGWTSADTIAELRDEIKKGDEDAKISLFSHLKEKEKFVDAEIEGISAPLEKAKKEADGCIPPALKAFLRENQKKSIDELEKIQKALEYALVETKYLISRGSILNPDEMALDKDCVSIFVELEAEQQAKRRRLLEAEQTQDTYAETFVADEEEEEKDAKNPPGGSAGWLFGSKK